MSYVKQKDDSGDTYTLKAAQDGVNVDLQLDAAAGTDSEVKLKPGTNITLTEAADTITIDSAGAGGSIGVNQVAFGDPLNAGDIKGSNNFTFVDESGAVGADVKISGNRPTFTLEDDTDPTDYKSIFRQSGASGYWYHADSTGTDRQMIRVAASDIILNESGVDVDVRIEGQSEQNLFRTFSAHDNVGIGTQPGTDVERLHIKGTGADDTMVRLESTDDDADAGPVVDLYRNAAGPADNDLIGKITFSGNDDGGGKNEYARIRSILRDNTAGGEEGAVIFEATTFGNDGVEYLRYGTDPAQSAREVVVNDGSTDYVKFRVESDTNEYLLVTDPNVENVGIGTLPGAAVERLHIKGVGIGDSTALVRLETVNTAAGSSPHIEIYRNSATPADFDDLGEIKFIGNHAASSGAASAGAKVYSRITNDIRNPITGSESGMMRFDIQVAGTLTEFIRLDGLYGIVLNEGGNDMDFRVESNSNANMLNVNAGKDVVSIGSAATGTAGANGTLQVRDKTVSSYAYVGFSNTSITSEELDNDRMQSEIIVHKGAANHTYELPTGVAGMYFKFVSTSGNITIQPDTGDTINGGAAGASVTRTTDNQIYECLCYEANTWIVSNP